MTKRYIIRPDWIASKADGRQHYISGDKLIALYDLPPDQCIIQRSWRGASFNNFSYGRNDVILTVRHDGDYSLTDEERGK